MDFLGSRNKDARNGAIIITIIIIAIIEVKSGRLDYSRFLAFNQLRYDASSLF